MLGGGGTLLKSRVTFGCIALLGVAAGSGLANAEISNNTLSNFWESMKGIFKVQGSSSPSGLSQPLNPIQSISEFWTWTWSSFFSKAFEFISSGYEWVKISDNQNTITSFLKNFLDYEMLKQFVFHLPWTIWAWINILKEREMLDKIPVVFRRTKLLSLAFFGQSGAKTENLKLANWLYLRILVNPRKTLNILSRKVYAKKNFSCDESPPPPPPPVAEKDKKLLGYCFFNGNGQAGKGLGNPQLKTELKTFLETGKHLKEQPRKK